MARYSKNVRFYFLPAVATIAAPTASEMTAGKDFTCVLTPSGAPAFALTPQKNDTTDLCSNIETSNMGVLQVADVAVELWANYDAASNESVISGLMAEGTAGFVAIFEPKTDGTAATGAVGDKCDVWPVTVAKNNLKQFMRTENRKRDITLYVTGQPARPATVAA